MAYRSPTSTSRKSSHLISVTAPSMASSSASISQPVSPASGQNGMARTDQIIYRIYLKTVGVLVDSRLSQTQKGGEGDERERERRKDKWFNLVIPEVDIHKADIQVYKSISTYSAQDDSVPPLLVAFILDTSDIPTSQALIWNRASGKSTLDPSKIGKGKGKAKESRSGIVLERWTFQASAAEYLSEGSETAPYTAYRMGIIHFRALYSILRTLPAYNLYRKLRRSNSGLRLGMKLWAPEGYLDTEAGLKEAWEVMEQDLVGLDAGLDSLVSSETVEPEQDTRRYDLPPLELFGNEYSLSVDYRPEVDIAVEDLESVLSEKFVDMEEDWFTPTVARHRMGEGSNPSSVASSNPPSRRVATPTAIPSSNPAPIPHRQGPASIGSFQSGLGLGSRGRQVSSQSQKGTEPGSERWGAIGEGLPFATGTAGHDNTKGSPSSVASGAAVAARRLSGHSIHPFTSASPSTSNLRGSPSPYAQGPSPTLAPRPSIAQPSSIGRTSSFLSQSGRSFTHAQLAHMYTGSTSPPVTGDMSREHLPLASSPNTAQPLVSPTSLSFSKQPLPRSVSGRQPSYTGSSPFIPSSLERENSMPPPALPHSQGSKRYPSSLSTSQGQRARVSSYGSSGGEGERTSQNLLRRSSTRMSTESGLRHSLEAPDRQATSVPDNDDIQSFLKTLDTLPQPPSLAAQASRARMPSASSSLSNTSIPHSPSILNPNSPSNNAFAGRAPVTRAQVDDAVKRMTGSFVVNTKTLEQSSLLRPESRAQEQSPPTRAPSVGLLSASRPVTSARRVSPAALGHGQGSIETSGISPSSVKRNSPLSGAPYPPAPSRSNPDPQAVKTSLPLSPPLPPPPSSTIPRRSQSTARSLPAGPGLVADNLEQSAPISGFLSPQPTGPARSDARSTSNQRRGPVLLRGGFEGRSQSQFKTGSGQRQSTSPSRSPIRDYSRLGAVSSVGISSRAGGESQAEAELIGWRRYRSEQRIQLRARGGGEEGEEGIDENDDGVRPQNTTGVRRQSTGAGNVLGDAAKDRGGGAGQAQGQQTAPSSLGRYSPESD